MATIVGGKILPLASLHGGKISRWESCTIDASMFDALTALELMSWAQLVTARCLVLIVGCTGSEAGGILSDFGWFHDMEARTVRSCLFVVA
jgi:hypothetical protein